MSDPVDHPAHYESDGVPTIYVLEGVIDGLSGRKAYLLGNVLKYVIRCGRKGSAEEDIAKANNYAHRLVTGRWRWEKVSKEKKDPALEVCHVCCEWYDANVGKSPATVADTYPKMMRKVLTGLFGMSKKAAKEFVRTACDSNWDRLHESRAEKELGAEQYADMLMGDVFYCSDRWMWDRVLRCQWLYQRIRDRVRDARIKEGEKWW